MPASSDQTPLRVVVSGSFHRHLPEIQDVVREALDSGHAVLSPADPRVVDAFGDFLFVASDIQRSIRLVQSRHLQAIAAADFLWLVCTDGYVGPSAALEVGYAIAEGKPVLSGTPPLDLTIRQYVSIVSSFKTAIERASQQHRSRADVYLLVDPAGAIESAHAQLDRVRATLLTPRRGDEGQTINDALRNIDSLLSTP